MSRSSPITPTPFRVKRDLPLYFTSSVGWIEVDSGIIYLNLQTPDDRWIVRFMKVMCRHSIQVIGLMSQEAQEDDETPIFHHVFKIKNESSVTLIYLDNLLDICGVNLIFPQGGNP
jgi:hypothetical protein